MTGWEMTLLVVFGAGTVPGFFVGRQWAEIFNARFQMKRTWENRRAYRE